MSYHATILPSHADEISSVIVAACISASVHLTIAVILLKSPAKVSNILLKVWPSTNVTFCTGEGAVFPSGSGAIAGIGWARGKATGSSGSTSPSHSPGKISASSVEDWSSLWLLSDHVVSSPVKSSPHCCEESSPWSHAGFPTSSEPFPSPSELLSEFHSKSQKLSEPFSDIPLPFSERSPVA